MTISDHEVRLYAVAAVSSALSETVLSDGCCCLDHLHDAMRQGMADGTYEVARKNDEQVGEVARKLGVHPSRLRRWRRLLPNLNIDLSRLLLQQIRGLTALDNGVPQPVLIADVIESTLSVMGEFPGPQFDRDELHEEMFTLLDELESDGQISRGYAPRPCVTIVGHELDHHDPGTSPEQIVRGVHSAMKTACQTAVSIIRDVMTGRVQCISELRNRFRWVDTRIPSAMTDAEYNEAVMDGVYRVLKGIEEQRRPDDPGRLVKHTFSILHD